MEDAALRNYLDDLKARYHYLDFRGIKQLEKVIELELDEVFVPLDVAPCLPPEGCSSLGRAWSDGERCSRSR